MTKNRFFYAALFAATLSFGLTSCNTKDDDEIVLDNTIKSTIAEEVLQKSTDVNIPPVEQTPAVVEMEAGAPVSKVVMCSNNKFIAYTATKSGRAIVDGSNVFTGTYDISLAGFVINSPELGLQITIPLDLIGSVKIGDDAYAIASSLKVPDSATPTELSICRTWSNPTYTAGVYFDKLPVYGTKVEDKAGLSSIKDLSKTVLNRIIAKDSNLRDEGFELLSSDIESLTFTSSKVYLRYENARVEESTWEWIDQSKGQLKTVIDGKDVTLEARFEKGNPNKAYFVIDANCTGVGGLGVHTLSGRLVCTMTESSK